jgi:hypothetical protein
LYELPSKLKYWIIGISFYAFIAVVVLLIAWLWMGAGLRALYQQNRFSLKLLLSLIIPLPLAITAAFLGMPFRVDDPQAEKLFPQATEMGPVFFRTFANNGKVTKEFSDETPSQGPHGYLKITLKLDLDDLRDNAGWVFYLTRGVDISRYNELHFQIRGATGSEKIGLKMKDAQGTEVGVMLNNYRYLHAGQITTSWQEATVSLDDFGKVNFKLMDSMTLYTDGTMAGTVPQTIYLGGFTLVEAHPVAALDDPRRHRNATGCELSVRSHLRDKVPRAKSAQRIFPASAGHHRHMVDTGRFSVTGRRPNSKQIPLLRLLFA